MIHAISEAERAYIEEGATQGIRGDGRGMLDLRPVTLETGILAAASGSARVRIGGVTDILVGVKAEMAEPSVEAPEEGLMSFSVECSSLASPDFVGRGGADLNAELGQMLARLYRSNATKAMRKGLLLIRGKKCWILHVDALVLDSGGNLFGALSLAVRAALRGVVLPRVVVIAGEADEDDEIEVDEEVFEGLKSSEEAPVAVTVAVLGKGKYMVDCTSEEEMCAEVAVTMGVNLRGRACGIVSRGTGGVEVDRLNVMLKDAVKVGMDILEGTDSFLEEDRERRESGEPVEPVGFFS